MLREHEIEIRVRYTDTDPMGLLHHSNYLTYFEIARTELLRASGGSYRQMEQEGWYIVVVRAKCHFQQPAHYDDLLRIRTTVTRATPVKMQHEYQVFRDSQRLAVGHVTLAIIDRHGTVCRVPRWMRDLE
jgi:acyl-CoA thioester hydrolase